jgi:hypothetical protein
MTEPVPTVADLIERAKERMLDRAMEHFNHLEFERYGRKKIAKLRNLDHEAAYDVLNGLDRATIFRIYEQNEELDWVQCNQPADTPMAGLQDGLAAVLMEAIGAWLDTEFAQSRTPKEA